MSHCNAAVLSGSVAEAATHRHAPVAPYLRFARQRRGLGQGSLLCPILQESVCDVLLAAIITHGGKNVLCLLIATELGHDV